MRAERWVVLLLLALVPAFHAPRPARAAGKGIYALRQQDYPVADHIVGVHGFWLAPPAGRAIEGQVRYMVRIVSPRADGAPAVVDFGILDAPGAAAPIVFSNCGACWDAEAGLPPPSAGWRALANHGALQGRTEFEIAYDEQNDRWAWYLNGAVVRTEERSRAGAGQRVAVGALAESETELLHDTTIDELLTFQTKAGWQIYEPNDALWPETTTEGVVILCDTTGSVMIRGRRSPLLPPPSEHGATNSEGGVGGAIVRQGDRILAAIGASVQEVARSAPNAVFLTPTARYTSTVTALGVVVDGLLTGLRSGTLIYEPSPGTALARESLQLPAPISAVAVADDAALIGTTEGDLRLVRWHPGLYVAAQAALRGRIRSLAAYGDVWAVGRETVETGEGGGELLVLRDDGVGSLVTLGILDLTAAPVALLVRDNALVVAEAGGKIISVSLSNPRAPSRSALAQVADTISSMTVSGDRLFVLGDHGDVWSLRLTGDGAEVIDSVHLGQEGGALLADESELVVTSLTGTVSIFELSVDRVGAENCRVTHIGSAVDIAATGERVFVLDGRTRLQLLDQAATHTSAGATIELRSRGTGVRSWPGGAAVLDGLAGVTLYDAEGVERARLRTGGVARDVSVVGQYAYVAIGTRGVKVFDLLDPTGAPALASIDTATSAAAVRGDGNLLLIGQLRDGIVIVDVHEPSKPTVIGHVATATDIHQFGWFGDRSLAGVSYGGAVVEIGFPPEVARLPTLICSVSLHAPALAIDTTHGADVVVATGRSGVLSVTLPSGESRRMVPEFDGAASGVASTASTTYAALGTAGIAWWARDHNVFFPWSDS